MMCKTLVSSTIFYLCFWIHIFELGFGLESCKLKDCHKLLNKRFQLYKEQHNNTKNTSVPKYNMIVIPNLPSHNTTLIMACLASRNQEQPTPQEDKVETFLKKKLFFNVKEIDSNNASLKWWRANMNKYPSLS